MVVSDSLQPHGLYSPWNSPGQNGQPFPSPGDLSNLVIEPRSPTLQADSLPAKPQGKTHTSPKSYNAYQQRGIRKDVVKEYFFLVTNQVAFDFRNYVLA